MSTPNDIYTCNNMTSAGPCPYPFGHHPVRECRVDEFPGRPACTDDGEPCELAAVEFLADERARGTYGGTYGGTQ